MSDKCPFCEEPAVRTSVSGVRFRCGTAGPDINGEYSTGHTCDISTFTRCIRELEQANVALTAERDRLRTELHDREQYDQRVPDPRRHKYLDFRCCEAGCRSAALSKQVQEVTAERDRMREVCLQAANGIRVATALDLGFGAGVGAVHDMLLAAALRQEE